MEKTEVEIQGSYITLGQFLKLSSIISSGGMAKPFLQQMEVYVNEELEDRRGKKLYDGDSIRIPNIGEFQIKASPEKDNECI
jgi:S4 domain protein YaaA